MNGVHRELYSGELNIVQDFFEQCSKNSKTRQAMLNETATNGRRAALREALIDAAERIIAERGYQALRARELAQDVGCALGAIYNVFPDLDGLIVAVKARTLDELDAEIAKRTEADDFSAASDAAMKRMQMLAQTYLAFASERPKQWQSLFEHRSPHANVAYHARLQQIFVHIERPLEAIMPETSVRQRQLFAQALFSAVHGVVALGLDNRLGELPANILAWQVRAIVQAVGEGVTANPDLAPLL
jgi:AcrR family transcriptional regulator